MRKKLPVVLAAAALVVAVLAWQTPAIAHGVKHAMFAHNAHKVDGRHANQLVRSAHTSFETGIAVGSSSVELMSTTIKVPKKGFLIVTASAVFTGSGGELIHCGVELGDVPNWVSTDGPGQSVDMEDNSPHPCAATFRFPVGKGQKEISFDAHNDGVGSLNARGGSLTVLYEPYGRTGKVGKPQLVAPRATQQDVNH